MTTGHEFQYRHHLVTPMSSSPVMMGEEIRRPNEHMKHKHPIRQHQSIPECTYRSSLASGLEAEQYIDESSGHMLEDLAYTSQHYHNSPYNSHFVSEDINPYESSQSSFPFAAHTSHNTKPLTPLTTGLPSLLATRTDHSFTFKPSTFAPSLRNTFHPPAETQSLPAFSTKYDVPTPQITPSLYPQAHAFEHLHQTLPQSASPHHDSNQLQECFASHNSSCTPPLPTLMSHMRSHFRDRHDEYKNAPITPPTPNTEYLRRLEMSTLLRGKERSVSMSSACLDDEPNAPPTAVKSNILQELLPDDLSRKMNEISHYEQESTLSSLASCNDEGALSNLFTRSTSQNAFAGFFDAPITPPDTDWLPESLNTDQELPEGRRSVVSETDFHWEEERSFMSGHDLRSGQRTPDVSGKYEQTARGVVLSMENHISLDEVEETDVPDGCMTVGTASQLRAIFNACSGNDKKRQEERRREQLMEYYQMCLRATPAGQFKTRPSIAPLAHTFNTYERKIRKQWSGSLLERWDSASTTLTELLQSECRNGIALVADRQHIGYNVMTRWSLVDFLRELAYSQQCSRRIFYLSVEYFDRVLFLTAGMNLNKIGALLAVICWQLAAKFDEGETIPVRRMLELYGEEKVTNEEFQKVEIFVLKTLSHRLSLSTAYDFLSLYFEMSCLMCPRLSVPGVNTEGPSTRQDLYLAALYLLDISQYYIHATLPMHASAMAAAVFSFVISEEAAVQGSFWQDFIKPEQFRFITRYEWSALWAPRDFFKQRKEDESLPGLEKEMLFENVLQQESGEEFEYVTDPTVQTYCQTDYPPTNTGTE